jgi:phosphoribosylaminoimidazole-succinocarboxamide synthase
LNQLAAWWFESTRDIVRNHFVSCPDPNVTIGRTARPLPVEVVVRGAMTGSTSTSIWRQYSAGARTIYGYSFPDGIAKNTLLPEPIVTPTTKAEAGGHDEPLSCADVVSRGFVKAELWEQVQEAALNLFKRGQQVAAQAGLLLADTKYEFGLDTDGQLMLIDEMHTPDSSRFWEMSNYEARIAAGQEPESLDKEPIRLALDAMGYRGDGLPPVLSVEVIDVTTHRYIAAYERLTKSAFVRGDYPVQERLDSLIAEDKLS